TAPSVGVQIRKPPTSVSIAQQSNPTYEPGSEVTVTNIFTYSGNLLSLLLGPQPPTGWQVKMVTGDGNPELFAGEILWTGGTLPLSPITIVYTLAVPLGEDGPKAIQAQVDYQLEGTVNPATTSPSPLVLN